MQGLIPRIDPGACTTKKFLVTIINLFRNWGLGIGDLLRYY